jgi:hypothetical protein
LDWDAARLATAGVRELKTLLVACGGTTPGLLERWELVATVQTQLDALLGVEAQAKVAAEPKVAKAAGANHPPRPEPMPPGTALRSCYIGYDTGQA